MKIFLSNSVKIFKNQLKLTSRYFSSNGDLWFNENEVTKLEDILKKQIPEKEYEEARRILYGPKCQELELNQKATDMATELDMELKGYKIPTSLEEGRPAKIVRVAAVQNQIKSLTTEKVTHQLDAMHRWAEKVVRIAALSGTNILCFQECWPAPFFMCTREKNPWLEFAESPEHGPTAALCKRLSKEHNMVIMSPILERNDAHETLHNSVVVWDNKGRQMGLHRKNHIPRVGDFNESSYYMEGDTKHPVFETEFGRIAANICQGRHIPMNWMMFALNGAEIIFNPSATVGKLSEHLWPIEARCAAMANHVFTVPINRIGTETYPNEFTSGDGKPAHKDFGHFYGSTYLAAPDGSRTPGLSRVKDGILISEIDLNLCRQLKDRWQFIMTSRWEMYSDSLKEFVGSNFKPNRIK